MVDRFDFDTVQTITAFGFITLEVPALWRCRRSDEHGMWECCGPEEEESGTFFIDYSLLIDPVQARTSMAAQRLMAAASADQLSRTGRDGAEEHMLRWQEEGVEDSMPLLLYRWHWFRFMGDRAVILHFSLVVLRALAEQEQFQELALSMDERIRNARIDPMPPGLPPTGRFSGYRDDGDDGAGTGP